MEKPNWYPILVNYLANPFDNRTLEELCAEINVSQMQLWRYRKQFKSELAEDVKKERAIAIDSMRAQAWKALANKLKTDSNALKLFFQLSGDLVEKIEQTNKYESVEQKREKLADLLNKAGMTLQIKDYPQANSTDKPNTTP